MQPARFLLLSPLAMWRSAELAISPEMHIRRLSPDESAALAPSQPLLQHHGIDPSAPGVFWFCHAFENPYASSDGRYGRRLEAAQRLAHHAMYALQILLPFGAANLFLLYRLTEEGMTLDSTRHRPAFHGTFWASLCEVPAGLGADLPILHERVHDAFQKPTLRLQIPVWLLEQGLSAPDRHIRILLWATGLDSLTRSGGVAAFAARLCSLLGPETPVFPVRAAGRCPGYKVADVAEDLYLLRTEMAHGLPFHEKFRKKRGFLSADGQPVGSEFADWRYDHVLEECAGFLLCAALREAFLKSTEG